MTHRILRFTVSSFPLALLVAMALVLVLLGTVVAQTPSPERSTVDGEWRVCKTGDPSCDFATIQGAINAAQEGDTIKVAGGIYDDVFEQPWDVDTYYPYTPTQVAFVSKTLTIRGGYAAGSWTQPNPAANPTTVDGKGQGRGIYILAMRDVTLENLRVINGHGESKGQGSPSGGGGIRAEDYYSGTLSIRNCEVLSSTATGEGAGVYLRLGVLALTNSRIVSNTSTQFGGGLYVRDAQVTMTGNQIERNISGGQGGGLDLYQCTAYVAGNTFRANRSDWDGGAVRATWGNVEFKDNMIIDNVADGRGGGLQVDLGDNNTYTMTGNLIKGNVACVVGNGTGGGVSISNGSGWLLFSENEVLSNTASQAEGGRGYGGGVSVSGRALVSNNLIQGNMGCTGVGCGGIGGGLSLKGNVWLERNQILDNQASTDACAQGWCAGDNRGGGVSIHNQTRVTMTNNIIAGNKYGETTITGKDDRGGAIYLGGQTDPQDCSVIAHHNTIADNQSPAILNESAGLEMSHTILAGHDLDIETIRDTSGLGPVPVTKLDYTLWWPGQALSPLDGSVINASNDMVGDPVFVARAGDGYHIGLGSAAEDRGPGVGVDIDIDGMRRPLGGAFDIGADEAFQVCLPVQFHSYPPQSVP